MTPSNDCPPHVFIISLLQTLLIIIIIAVHLSMYNKSCLLKKLHSTAAKVWKS